MIEMFKATLSNENISSACEQVHEVLVQRKMNAKDIVRLKLSLEEVLLRFQEQLGQDTSFEIKFGRRLTRRVIKLSVAGPSINPLTLQDEDEESLNALMQKALNNTNPIPVWEFSNGKNIISYAIAKQQLPEWSRLLIAVIAAVVCGFMFPMLPDEVEKFLLQDILDPLINSFGGILTAVAVPLIFLSVISGICNIGDVTAFIRIGNRLILKIFTSVVFIFSIAAVLSQLFFNLEYGTASTNTANVASVVKIILGIIPNNLFKPFAAGNLLQILFLAFIIGVAMVVIGEPVKPIVSMLGRIELIIFTLMDFIGKLIPFYVFGSILQVFLGDDMKAFKALGKVAFIFIIFSCLILLAHSIIISLRTKISIWKLWRNSFSTFLIGLTTASSAAALSNNIESCINKFNINPRLAKFGVPFCQILYRPNISILIWLVVLTSAELHNIQISFSWLALTFILAFLFSIAETPAAGGMVATYMIVFPQLGIPIDNTFGIFVALSTMLDFIGTATNLACGQCFLFDFSVKAGMNESKAA